MLVKNVVLLSFILSIVYVNGCTEVAKKIEEVPSTEEWQVLFNGEDLEGWTPKIAGFDYGVNAMNTFRVDDGILEINYEDYDTFTTQYGHLFYKEPYAFYHLEVEYRFKGDQTPGGQGWAYRNSGIMFHSQDPKTMSKDQSFPICLEFQFLGGNGTDERSTGNLCTPATHVSIDGELVTTHCINSNSQTYHGDQWVTAGLIVYGDSIIHHLIEGDTVMTYTKPICDKKDDLAENGAYTDGQAMKDGYFALQAESHPMEYKSVKIKKIK